MSCDVGNKLSSDAVLLWLWLWYRQPAIAAIQPLAWELPYAVGAGLKRPKKKKELDIVRYGQSSGAMLNLTYKFASNRLIFPTDVSLYHFCPGDWVLLKSWKNNNQLHPCRTRIYEVLPMTHSLVMLKGVKPRFHHT